MLGKGDRISAKNNKQMNRDNYQRSSDAFAKLRKATLHGFVMSARSAWNNSAPKRTDFHEILCLRIFRKSAGNISRFITTLQE